MSDYSLLPDLFPLKNDNVGKWRLCLSFARVRVCLARGLWHVRHHFVMFIIYKHLVTLAADRETSIFVQRSVAFRCLIFDEGCRIDFLSISQR